MQSSNKDRSHKDPKDTTQVDAELSATWQALLGLQGSGEAQTPPVDPTAPVQPLASDPWSSLLNASGMQPVDLQKAHLHDLHTLDSDDPDIEQALNIMREATGQLPKLKEKKTEDA